MGALRALMLLAVLLGLAGLAACGGEDENGDREGGEPAADLPRGAEHVELDPSEFTTEIDNPYFPLASGSRWVYRESDGEGTKKVVVTVTEETREIANGVTARVVHDVVSEDGELIENTFDWYAQDAEGNVWYLGEATTEYEDGRPVSREGSFEAGVDGAEAGVIMTADPRPGLSYRQEYYEGEAEDRGRVLRLDGNAQVPAGSYSDLLVTLDVNPLDRPPAREHKFYARGVGPVLTIALNQGGGREELLSFSKNP